MPGTTVISGATVYLDDTDELNVRIKVLNLQGAEILEAGIEPGPKPAVSTVFHLPQALQVALLPLAPGALPDDTEALKEIITDLDYKLADCQRVATAQFMRLTKINKSLANDLYQTRNARENDKKKNTEKVREINGRLLNQEHENRRLSLIHVAHPQSLLEQNRILRQLVRDIHSGKHVDVSNLDALVAAKCAAMSQPLSEQETQPTQPVYMEKKLVKARVRVIHDHYEQVLSDANQAATTKAEEQAMDYVAKLNGMREEITELHRTLNALKVDPAKRKAIKEGYYRQENGQNGQNFQSIQNVQNPPGAQFMADVRAAVDGIYEAASDQLLGFVSEEDIDSEMKDA